MCSFEGIWRKQLKWWLKPSKYDGFFTFLLIIDIIKYKWYNEHCSYSVTMTLFYVLLYYVWRFRYQLQKKSKLTITIWALALLRIVLCMMPQNAWTSAEAPLSWGIYRNIPFTILGVVIVILFYCSARSKQDQPFRSAITRWKEVIESEKVFESLFYLCNCSNDLRSLLPWIYQMERI